MRSFFAQDEGATDCVYHNVKADDVERKFTEELWREFQGLEGDAVAFLKEALQNFDGAFWEMCLGVALRRGGLEPERVGAAGPDFLVRVDGLRAWIEATAPEPGERDDKVLRVEEDPSHRVPNEKIALRITSAIREKQRQFRNACERGIASRDDALVVAINGWRLTG